MWDSGSRGLNPEFLSDSSDSTPSGVLRCGLGGCREVDLLMSQPAPRAEEAMEEGDVSLARRRVAEAKLRCPEVWHLGRRGI